MGYLQRTSARRLSSFIHLHTLIFIVIPYFALSLIEVPLEDPSLVMSQESFMKPLGPLVEISLVQHQEFTRGVLRGKPFSDKSRICFDGNQGLKGNLLVEITIWLENSPFNNQMKIN